MTHINARLFGIFFILTFLSYGIGSTMVTLAVDTPEGLTNIFAHKSAITIGVVLMAVLHTVFNISLPILMLPLLKPVSNTLAYFYLALAITATLVLVVGAIFTLLLLPLSDAYVAAAPTNATPFELLETILKKGNFYSYQLGMTLWGIGGLMFVYMLHVSKAVPRALTLWGMLGYVVFITGTTAEIFGYPIGVLLSALGGLFEIALSIWLITKGISIPATHLGGGYCDTPLRG